MGQVGGCSSYRCPGIVVHHRELGHETALWWGFCWWFDDFRRHAGRQYSISAHQLVESKEGRTGLFAQGAHCSGWVCAGQCTPFDFRSHVPQAR